MSPKKRRRRYSVQQQRAIAASIRGTQETARNPDRWVYAQSLRDAGHTLDDIGKALGVTRERVRQKTQACGFAASVDPIMLVRLIRAQVGVTSYEGLAAAIGVGAGSVIECVDLLSMRGAVDRLFRWRRHAPTRRRYAAIVLNLAARLGRTPTYAELAEVLGIPKTHAAPKLASIFGSGPQLWRYVGLTPNRRGAPGHRNRGPSPTCRRGHPRRVAPGGYWTCDECNRQRDERARARRKTPRLPLYDPFLKSA